MPVSAIILLLISASLHALWNLILKRSEEKYIAMGWRFLGEQMGGTRVLGAAIIFAGILVITIWG